MFTLISSSILECALEQLLVLRRLITTTGKHLQGYVNDLNAVLSRSQYDGICDIGENKEFALMELILQANPEGEINAFKNTGLVLNHNLYFKQFCGYESYLLAQYENFLPHSV